MPSCTPINEAIGPNMLHWLQGPFACRLLQGISFHLARTPNLRYLKWCKNPLSLWGLSCWWDAWIPSPRSLFPTLPGPCAETLPLPYVSPSCRRSCSFGWLSLCCDKVQIKGLQADGWHFSNSFCCLSRLLYGCKRFLLFLKVWSQAPFVPLELMHKPIY